MLTPGNPSHPPPAAPRARPRRAPWTWHLPVLQLAAITLTLDQLTKLLVRELLPFRSSFPAEGFLRLTHTHNTGSAFGVFQGQNTPLIFISFIGIGVLLAIYFSQPRPGNLLRLSLGLQLGGAVGNLVDRLHQGWVTDFIDVGPWPVFNLADASIVTGLLILAWIFLRPSARPRAPEAAPAQSWDGQRDLCPLCGGEMLVLAVGWRCADCGVRERLDLPRQATPAAVSTSLPRPDDPPGGASDARAEDGSRPGAGTGGPERSARLPAGSPGALRAVEPSGLGPAAGGLGQQET